MNAVTVCLVMEDISQSLLNQFALLPCPANIGER